MHFDRKGGMYDYSGEKLEHGHGVHILLMDISWCSGADT